MLGMAEERDNGESDIPSFLEESLAGAYRVNHLDVRDVNGISGLVKEAGVMGYDALRNSSSYDSLPDSQKVLSSGYVGTGTQDIAEKFNGLEIKDETMVGLVGKYLANSPFAKNTENTHVKMILENSVKMGQIKDDKMGYINSYIDSHKKGDTKFLETAIYSDVNLFIGLEIEGLSKDTVSAMKDYKLNSLVKDMTNSYKMSEKDVTKANETIRRIKSLPLDKINAKNLKDKEDAEKILQNNATSGQIFGEIFQSFYDDYSATQKAKAA